MHEAAVAYLEQVDSDGHALYRRVTRAALWMDSTCAFLKETQAEVPNPLKKITFESRFD